MEQLVVTNEGAMKIFSPVSKKPRTLDSIFNFVEIVYNDLYLSGGSMSPKFKEIKDPLTFVLGAKQISVEI